MLHPFRFRIRYIQRRCSMYPTLVDDHGSFYLDIVSVDTLLRIETLGVITIRPTDDIYHQFRLPIPLSL